VSFDAVPTVSAREAAARFEDRRLALIDVREPEEWEAGRIPGAIHIPLGELGERWEEVQAAMPVAFVCRSGARSALATQVAVGTGLEAANLEGGMQSWAAAGLPMEPGGAHVA
jgi:rhodanese-related sulfurtransferase